LSALEKLLKEWARATAEAQFNEFRAFCAPRGQRSSALRAARMAAQRAQRLERILKVRGVDPNELLARGEIK
jgi:cystathionine beta-lyase/cystathionine gamma-synthase